MHKRLLTKVLTWNMINGTGDIRLTILDLGGRGKGGMEEIA